MGYLDTREHEHRAKAISSPVTSGLYFPDWISASPSIAFDIETDASVNVKTGSITAVALSDGTNAHFMDVRGEDLLIGSMLHVLFREKQIIGHNLAFDLMFVKEKYGVEYPTNIYDTQVAEQTLTAGRDDLEVGLDDTVLRYFGIELSKDLQLSFGCEGPFTEEQERYAVSDVLLLHSLMDRQIFRIKEENLETTNSLETAVLPIFAEMVRYGVMINQDTLLPQLERTKAEHAALTEELRTVLSPAILNKQIADFDAMQAELDEWNDAYNHEISFFENYWQEMYADDGLSDLEDMVEWEQNKWTDTTINKKDQKPEGQRRFVKHQMKIWRQTHHRPLRPKLDTSLINLNSQLQLHAAFDFLGISCPNFKKDSLATVLADTTDPDQHAMLTSLISYKKAEKLLSSFGEPLVEKIGPDGRLRGNFRQIGTATGRPSCSSPNMLQIPKRGQNKKFRKNFIPGEGYLFVRADYSQMELRLMAQLSGDKAMQKAFVDGLDLHAYTASLMFKVSIEDVTNDQRATAKTINFGILYGMGPTKLRATLAADGIHMGKQDAYNAVQLWKNTYRQASATIDSWGNQALRQGFTATAWGRKRYFNIEHIEDRAQEFAIKRAGANHPIQGGNADITKMAMILIESQLEKRGTIVLQVYDEIVVEVLEADAWWARDVVESCMNLAGAEVLTTVPCAVEAQVSTSWSEEDALQNPVS